MHFINQSIDAIIEATIIPAPPFPDLLHTNHSPSSSEADLIRRSISQAQSNLSLIEDLIAKLVRRQEALRDYVDDHQALLSPVKHLPPELLGLIFKLCLPEWRGDMQATMIPSHVCKHWRNIALSTPSLWSAIYLDVSQRHSKSRMELIREWLPRTREHTLALELAGWKMKPVIDLFLPYCHRWHSIHITCTMKWLRCFQPAQGCLTHLEALMLSSHYPGNPVDSDQADSIRIFESAPKLRQVRFNSEACNVIALPWSQLTHYDGFCSINRCLQILDESPNMLKLEVNIKNDTQISRTVAVTAFNLVSLSIFSITDLAVIYDNLPVPALRELQVTAADFTESTNSSWHRKLPFFLARSSCALQQLIIRGKISSDTFMQSLQVTPTLVSLELDETTTDACLLIADTLRPQIVEGGQTICLVPRLQTVRLCYHNLSVFDLQGVADMITARWRLGNEIQILKIIFKRKVPMDRLLNKLQPLLGMVENGLDVVVVDGDGGEYFRLLNK